VRLRDEDVSGLPERFLTEIRRRTFGFVFQQFNLVRGLSALDNVMLPAYPLGLPYGQLREKAENQLAGLDLGHRRAARVEWLSGGEQQRVAIARALINDPEVIIADEPTANLDTTLSRQFLDILGRLIGEGRTVVLTSHDPLVVESSVVGRVVRLRDGRLVDSAA
jgi:putative ABC transport system ATP-binding protein